jgi:hypothetical protein
LESVSRHRSPKGSDRPMKPAYFRQKG